MREDSSTAEHTAPSKVTWKAEKVMFEEGISLYVPPISMKGLVERSRHQCST